MKSLTTLLQNGNLTPKERYLLLVHNDMNKYRTGTNILSEADKRALENWHAKTSSEAQEWNRYNEGWKYSGRMDLEGEFIFLNAQTEHFRKQPIIFNLLFYPFHREMRGWMKRIKQIKKVDVKKASEIAEKQRSVKLKDGLDFDYAVYQLAFESLHEEDKKKFTELYGDVEFDHQYLDQEETIADLFDGEDELTKEAKEKLAVYVSEIAYNFHAKAYQLYHYFACIPLAEVARQFLIDKGIFVSGKLLAKNQESDNEDDRTHKNIQEAIEHYAKDNKITVEAILKEGCLKWLDGDLFEQYRPLVISNEKELLERWLKTKIKAEATLKKLISRGELKAFEIRPQDGIVETIDINSEPEGIRVITGESLYNFTGDYKFVRDFKKRVDEYEPNLGIVYENDDPDQNSEHLDQELLICGLNDKNEANIFSMFGLSISRLENIFESMIFFKETERNGETFLEFDDDKLEKTFMEETKDLVDGYADLLAFKKLFDKLSEIYEIDLAYRVKQSLKQLENYIDRHNEALAETSGQRHGEIDDNWIINRGKILKIKENLLIDKEKIVPDMGAVDEHMIKLKEILGGDFNL